ncbi:tetratricopeptide repeat protein [Caballeronia ptereochthonis]|uniref:Tetratricopeptide repeat protein n=1 Tax=Caballeronia ptereochthonis TaxID=1777144 RepID=A0A158BRI1_9BURK|nr:tetratricopeptide repeat-containing glycosyltransferase family protein [Caballeronia ptereochthonis]SAK72663.1 tetratricopeptide repeat protein [Caballeronia ptereochthonis]
MSVSENDPSFADEKCSEAEDCYRNGRFDEALNAVDAAFRAGFESAALWNVAAASFMALRREADAERCLRRAIELYPASCQVHSNLGALLSAQSRYAEAEAEFQEALRIDPAHAEASNNLGVALQAQARWAEAEAAYRHALRVKPDFANASLNLGILCRDQGRFDDAKEAFCRLLAGRPDQHDSARMNLGILYRDNGRLPEAEAAFRQVSTDHPEQVSAKAELAHLALCAGNYAEGWALYENRYDSRLRGRNTIPPDIALPQWRGESLAGKSVLVFHEQGNGDTIQFSRYFPVLKQMGAARVTFACPERLHRLMRTARGLDVVIGDETLPAPKGYDCWTFLMSVPLHAGTTLENIPDAPGVLSVAEEDMHRWRPRLAGLEGVKVGLVWKGSAIHPNDQTRSLPGLAALAPLWTCPSVSFVSLQKGQGEDDAAHPPPGQPLVHVGSELSDFADSAAVIAQLDLIVCVDTAIAHLAGALGKPCWMMLPAIRTDWRWMRDRPTTPWYPTMRLFRQARLHDWTTPIEAMRAALAAGSRL